MTTQEIITFKKGGMGTYQGARLTPGRVNTKPAALYPVSGACDELTWSPAALDGIASPALPPTVSACGLSLGLPALRASIFLWLIAHYSGISNTPKSPLQTEVYFPSSMQCSSRISSRGFQPYHTLLHLRGSLEACCKPL